MIIRCFHPIGQGAFYTENIDNTFRIVYDCGTLSKGGCKLSKRLIDNEFSKDDHIDILFLSHFDIDHISGVRYLAQRCKIKRVVLPLLHNNEAIFLGNVFTALNRADIANIVINPVEYFGNDTKVFRVSPEVGDEFIDLNDDYINSDNQPRIIASMTKLAIRSLNWVFIPYNHELNIHNPLFLNEFKKRGLNIDNIDNTNYITANRIEIAKAYKNCGGNINDNSMLLYSGPVNCANKKVIEHSTIFQRISLRETLQSGKYSSGCIYCGDVNMNNVDIQQIYSNVWGSVGTVQIAHHGSKNSFSENFMINSPCEDLVCPISCGISNTYGHPCCSVISRILRHNNYPCIVTDSQDSVLTECYD
jgi:beta-lactamase superfamily II metal-dependent hydrolase